MIIPAIDLIDGNVVRLYQGDYQQKTEYQLNPIDVVHNYADAGANYLHIVDLTGAKDPLKRQTKLIKDMVATQRMPFQAGGGIRNKADVEQFLECGVSRVVVGSLAVKSPNIVLDWVREFGAEKIVLALDINIDAHGKRHIATHGWQENSGVELDSLLTEYVNVGTRHVLCTDISKDGTLQGANDGLYKDVVQQFPTVSWQASGGIGSLADIERVRATNVQNVILGRSLLEGKFSLKDAIQLWDAK